MTEYPTDQRHRCDFSTVLKCILLSLYALARPCYSSTDARLVFSVREELSPNTYVGNISSDRILQRKYSASVLNSLTYVFLRYTPLYHHFSLEERTGVLRTRDVIDRDVICPQMMTCVIRLDVAVQPSAYFEIIKVDVTVEDINDNDPSFPQARFRLEIPEDVAPYAERYPILAAIDVDSPPNGVLEYRLANFFLPSVLDTFRLDVGNSSSTVAGPRLVVLKVSGFTVMYLCSVYVLRNSLLLQ